jgi:hypothetical protein
VRGDPKIALSILSLSSSGPPWDTFVAGLREMEKKCLADLVAATDDTVFVAQGRARAVMEILSSIDNARTVADRQK